MPGWNPPARHKCLGTYPGQHEIKLEAERTDLAYQVHQKAQCDRRLLAGLKLNQLLVRQPKRSLNIRVIPPSWFTPKDWRQWFVTLG